MAESETALLPRTGHVFRLAAIFQDTTADLSHSDATKLAMSILECASIEDCELLGDIS